MSIAGIKECCKIDPGIRVVLPIKRKPGKKLSPEEKEYNKTQSKIRVYVGNAIRRVKTFRIMGDVYRNPLKKYDRINDIICGLSTRGCSGKQPRPADRNNAKNLRK